jgi:hypothetical protein
MGFPFFFSFFGFQAPFQIAFLAKHGIAGWVTLSVSGNLHTYYILIVANFRLPLKRLQSKNIHVQRNYAYFLLTICSLQYCQVARHPCPPIFSLERTDMHHHISPAQSLSNDLFPSKTIINHQPITPSPPSTRMHSQNDPLYPRPNPKPPTILPNPLQLSPLPHKPPVNSKPQHDQRPQAPDEQQSQHQIIESDKQRKSQKDLVFFVLNSEGIREVVKFLEDG